ncbi:MAG: DUF4248 domain-containing protein [Prevotella sp.]|nr:DUF4248 domain-containing protein [Prevotella sp.]MDT3387798.1 DUF4248 domain-containing protein [Bacteroidota bacterium]
MDDYPIRSYGRTELALAYNPSLDAQSAWRKLKEWIAYSKELTAALKQAGYDPRRRSFTPKQVTIIFECLGKP